MAAQAGLAPAPSRLTGGWTTIIRLSNEDGGPEGACTLNPPADNGALCSLSYESEMGSAGTAPVRHFRLYLTTPDLQSGSRITSQQNGSGSGSHTHLKKFMRLLSVHWSSFPQLKLVESVGNAPTSTCLQSRCIACLPRPRNENGRLPPCCPEVS